MTRNLVILFCVLASTAAAQQHAHTGHGDTTLPGETGQSAFAALAEIVSMLRDDPATDWSRVDIPALREHLVDMDLVSTDATVRTTPTETGATFHITGSGRTLTAIQTMALAHPPFAEAESGLTISAQATDDGAVWNVAGNRDMILGLGFHGILTIGAHHQAHHLALATGGNPHE